MNVIGEKVLLRAIEISDKEVLLEIINDSHTEYALGGWSFPVSSLNQEEWIKDQKPNADILRCMIIDKKDNKTLGTVILSDIDYKNGNAEIHIKLLRGVRGNGYGFDTINTIVKYTFNELRLHCVYAHINGYNIPSQKLFEKCGFKKEGLLKSRIFKKGEYHDVIILSIINEL
ncbi:GNAT family N-acetyltransferase [Peribacillus frigoritolerans]|uniref:GNAT family N-acetyltransferase n=1 Tax=Peribacillus frigoritolerans TaxID=450367 RepID=UPI0007BFBD24|nr:GNAT family protein [Peribacillus frigoritolerans]MED4694895.1 GNAT family protein [Peribacillus frigoritolerans]